jgi:hypothetical protein
MPTRALVVAVAVLMVVLAAAVIVEIASSGVRSLPPATGAVDQPLGNGKFRFFPRSGRVSLGVTYRFQAYTHCGLGWPGTVDFDGSFWDLIASSQAADGNVIDPGTMTLISPTLTQYRGGGIVIQFSRHAGPQIGVPCK